MLGTCLHLKKWLKKSYKVLKYDDLHDAGLSQVKIFMQTLSKFNIKTW